MNYNYRFALIILFLAAVSCSKSKPTVSLDQLNKDIVGKMLDYPNIEQVKIQPENIKKLSVEDRRTDLKVGTDEIHVLMTLVNDASQIEGKFIYKYKLYEQGWKLDNIEKGTYEVKIKPPTKVLFTVKNKKTNVVENISIDVGNEVTVSTGETIELLEFTSNVKKYTDGFSGPAVRVNIKTKSKGSDTCVVFKNFPDVYDQRGGLSTIHIEKFEL